MKRHADALGTRNEVQVIWQTGKYYEKEMEAFMAQRHYPNIWRGAFIDRMDYAYAAADVVVSRSGACSVSELARGPRPRRRPASPGGTRTEHPYNGYTRRRTASGL